tara:strand:+ start:166 stop:528 length:363 start_codon:yes stop_codon:yes gene_type:complete
MSFKSYKSVDVCPGCGGKIVGDGHQIAFHCENVDLPFDIEPDAGPIHCNYEGVVSTHKLVPMTFRIPAPLIDEIKTVQAELLATGEPGCGDFNLFVINLLQIAVDGHKIVLNVDMKRLLS